MTTDLLDRKIAKLLRRERSLARFGMFAFREPGLQGAAGGVGALDRSRDGRMLSPLWF
jgi:hypothetical protein